MDNGRSEESAGDIAIVGMSGRFPGAPTLDEFWRNLCDGVEAVSWFSEEELAASGVDSSIARQENYVRAAAVLEGIDMFDAAFFGCSPKEAQTLDPQQRLFLECAWEALEDAGTAPEAYEGEIGIYAGANISNYLFSNLYPRRGRSAFVEDFQTLIGNAKDYLATRASYKLNLTGPSVSVQTACSTSLVSVCLASQSLIGYQCDMALAGGVTVRVPQKSGYLHEPGGILSPDGRCRTFDAKAQGTTLGNGVGIVVLKRLEDALADGNRIHAIIKGSAINNDGANKIGYTAPSVDGQARVVKMAQALAGTPPETISYIEAHGTATALGDPIEIDALTQVFRDSTAAKGFCAIGSIKTNFGHLEAAAGVAGLIKTVLALKHRLLPPSLHFEQPNPEIDFPNSPFFVNTRLTEWKANGAPLRAGVSSFGIGGTNAHVVLEEAPARAATDPPPGERPLHILTLSAKTAEAMRQLAGKYVDHLAADHDSFADCCFTANTGRTHFAHRTAVIAGSHGEAREMLSHFLEGDKPPGLVEGRVEGERPPKVAFLFSGQASQYHGMGRQLYDSQPVFRKELDRCDRLLRGELDDNLLSVLYPESGSGSTLHETVYTQPALFALEYALAKVWQSWGVQPSFVLGHSVGEYVAACISGVMSLDDALRLVTARSASMQRLAQGGAMVAILTEYSRVAEAVAEHAAQVSIAAVNGPDNIVISGAGEHVARIAAQFEAEGIRVRQLTVSHAFHSPLMNPMLPSFERKAAQLTYSPPQIGLVSCLTGALARSAELSEPGYWVRHIREPVQFFAGMQTLHALGCEAFIEIGPGTTLLGMGKGCLPESASLWLPSLRQGRDEWRRMLESLAALHVRGAKADWRGYERGYSRRLVSVPTYPFQRERHWVEAPTAGSTPQFSAGRHSAATGHPLLGSRLRSPLREAQFELDADAESLPVLKDHRIYGVPVFPAAAYLEMAHAAAIERFGENGSCLIEDFVIHEPLLLNEPGRPIQLVLSPDGPERGSFRISSLAAGSDAWILHGAGSVSNEQSNGDAPIRPRIDREQAQQRCSETESRSEWFYKSMADRGLELGPSFQWIEQIWRRDGEAIARTRVANAQDRSGVYRIHPGLMDCCFQLLAAAMPEEARDSVYTPVELKKLRFYGRPNGRTWVRAVLRAGNESTATTIVSDLSLFDDSGNVLMEAEGLLARRAPREALTRETDRLTSLLYRVQWQPQPGAQDRLSSEHLASPIRIAESLHPMLEPLQREYGLAGYKQLMPEMDALGAEYAREAFHQLGCEFLPGRFDPALAARQMGVPDQQNRFFVRLVDLLENAGILKKVGSEWEVGPVPGRVDPHTHWAELNSRYPAFEAELVLLENCGRLMPKLLRGECNPLEVLLPGGSSTTLEKLYRDSPVSRVCNRLILEAVSQAQQLVPEGRTLRLLEIGAGTGGTTSHVLPCLEAHAADYVFTDVSARFTLDAERRFRDFPFVRYQVLDIERDPGEQGFAPHEFDVVLAANVLHATSDLRRTLSNVKRLLAPEGLLLLVEGTGPQRWLDLIFGLTDGWWKFTDRDLRPAHPLLPQDKWTALLKETAFTEAVAMPEASQEREDVSQPAVILARGPGPAEQPSRSLIFADRGGVGERLGKALAERRGACTLVFAGTDFARSSDGNWTADPAQPQDFQRLLRELGEQAWQEVVHLWSLDAPPAAGLTVPSLEDAQVLSCGSVLHLFQALAGADRGAPPRVSLVTRGAQPVGARAAPVSITQAEVWGLARVIAMEHPAFRCLCLDLDPSGGEDEIDALVAELLGPHKENQVALRSGVRYVPRLVGETGVAGGRLQLPRDEPFQLQVGSAGVLDNLVLRPVAARAPDSGEVQIRVRATGLNFRDVMHALGVYPGGSGQIGIECAGTIAAVGPGVDGFQVGQEVVALATGSFGSFVTTSAVLVVPKPAGLTHDEAASIPIVFLTAYHALHQLAGLSRGERVLIHAAAGGVGLAAVQLAQRAGAEIFATAGSPEKRDYLRSLGVAHVFHSRSIKFAGEVLESTGGEGVDVVLNSLAGDFIPKSLAVLRLNGRFLEIGKTGIWDGRQVAQVRKDVSYFVIALDQMIDNRSGAIGETFRGLMNQFEQGSLHPLPRSIYPIEDARDAFRYMAQARHIGKIVITQSNGAGAATGAMPIRSDATYLITGGLGGLGLLLAGWLVERGARNLVLLGRSDPSAAARETVSGLADAGARITVVAADVSREDDVAKALAGIRATMPPLCGILHCAGVLDDGVLLRQNWTRFSNVMAAKATGALNLHSATADMPLDFFVLFSSIASLVGPPGQSNHAAANAFLDSLAHYRHSLGLPALSINWGRWADIGAAASRASDLRSPVGIGAIPPKEGLRILEYALQQRCTQIVAMPVDWEEFSRRFADQDTPPLLSGIVRDFRQRAGANGHAVQPPDLLRRLREALPGDRRTVALTYLRNLASKALGLQASVTIDARQPLNELGLDSLMAIELRNSLAAAVGHALPATLLFDYPTLETLAGYLCRDLLRTEPGSEHDPGAPETGGESIDPSAGLDGIPDEEVAALLAAKLADLEADAT